MKVDARDRTRAFLPLGLQKAALVRFRSNLGPRMSGVSVPCRPGPQLARGLLAAHEGGPGAAYANGAIGGLFSIALGGRNSF